MALFLGAKLASQRLVIPIECLIAVQSRRPAHSYWQGLSATLVGWTAHGSIDVEGLWWGLVYPPTTITD
jgi:hypothetical protein